MSTILFQLGRFPGTLNFNTRVLSEESLEVMVGHSTWGYAEGPGLTSLFCEKITLAAASPARLRLAFLSSAVFSGSS
jgi:hypothetical protein